MRARQVYAAVVVFVTMVVLAIGNWAYTNYVDRQAERRNVDRAREICGLIVVLDDAYAVTPPATPVGQHLAAEIHRYRVALGC